MVRYSLAAIATLACTSRTVHGFVQLKSSRGTQQHKEHGGVQQMRRNLSSSTMYHEGDEEMSPDPARSLQNLRDDVNKLGSTYLETIQRAVQDDGDEDAYEAEMALKKKIVQERSRTYEVTLPLAGSRVDGLPLGLSLCQVNRGLEFSEVDLDLDTLRYLSSADMIQLEQTAETMNISELKQRLEENFQGIVVSGVVRGGLAWRAGVRPGDMLRATSATVGDALWPKSSLDGVKSAVSSRRVASSEMVFRFERSTVEIGSQYELTLTKPLGLQIQGMYLLRVVRDWDMAVSPCSNSFHPFSSETDDGYVEITGFTSNAQKLARFAIIPGDRILSVDSSIGDRMWPVSTVEGVISSCTSRLPGQPIRMRFLRPYSSEAGSQTAEMKTLATATAVSESSPVVVERVSKTAEKALLKRCRETLRRYSAEEQQSARSQFSGKYAVPALVADKVLDAVASAYASLDSITLSMVMNAYLSCRKPEKAIRAFEASVGLKADGSSTPVTEKITGKENAGILAPDTNALNLVTGSSLMRAHALLGDFASAQRVLAALEGRSGVSIDGVESAEWPRTGVYGSIVPDTQCYNIALSAAATSKDGFGVDAALELFRSMTEPRQTGRKPAKNLVSYNTIIGALSKQSRSEDAFSIFDEMKRAGVRPDKFTYTSLIQACVHSGDMQELLYDMREQGVQPDAITYNTMIKSLCQQLQLNEAKKLISEMESRGIAPDSMTYGHLMNGLLKAKKPSTCLTLFETACANLRTAPLMENVHLYTTAITAASAVGNHERAFELVSRMNAAGVKPNLKTLTALMGACLSSGKHDLAVSVYRRIDKPDGYAMMAGVRAMCASGAIADAAALISKQRSGTLSMSGKQVVESYQEVIRASLESEDYSLARKTIVSAPMQLS
jgi:pentatricopeptide repeat protein